MHLAFCLRHRHSLLMQLDPFKWVSAGSAVHNLKRPLSSAARPLCQAQTMDFSLDNSERPTKMFKIDGIQKPTAHPLLKSPSKCSARIGSRRAGGRSKELKTTKVSHN